MITAASSQTAFYRTIWRWHFYAGLLCIPIVLWLAVTGSIYLFKPQIDDLIDRPYDTLTIRGAPHSAIEEVTAALAAVPGTTLRDYELPRGPGSAARVIVGNRGDLTRVYVDPYDLAILKTVDEDDRFTRVIFHLHGELMLGDRGSIIVELAASWAIVLILTGLYLWWPRRTQGLAGVIYPRLGQGGRVFWRDLHAVTALWISALVLFMLLSGLPWAKSWGSYLKEVRHLTGTAAVHQDWTTGRSSEMAERMAAAPEQDMGGMGDMGGMHQGHGMAMPGMTEPTPQDYTAIDRMVATVAPLDLPYPALISPPRKAGGNWTARSDTQNRPLRVKLVLDAHSGAILKQTGFSNDLLIDRIVAVGVAAHEGQLFGLANQLLSVATALGLITVCVSALMMWWRRRPVGLLGAPPAVSGAASAWGLTATIVAMGLIFPLLGGSMIIVAVIERFALRRIPGISGWLGLSPMAG